MPGTVYISFAHMLNPQSMQAVLNTCEQLVAKRIDSLYLLVSTGGGSVDNGITMYNTLRGMPFELTTHNVGNVDSMGNVLFLAGAKRYASPIATFMFHGLYTDVGGQSRLEMKVVAERLESLEASQRKMIDIIANRTKIARGEALALFRQQATKDAEWAQQKGIVHEIRDLQIPLGAEFYNLALPPQGSTK